jgi:hypothetical protein
MENDRLAAAGIVYSWRFEYTFYSRQLHLLQLHISTFTSFVRNKSRIIAEEIPATARVPIYIYVYVTSSSIDNQIQIPSLNLIPKTRVNQNQKLATLCFFSATERIERTKTKSLLLRN